MSDNAPRIPTDAASSMEENDEAVVPPQPPTFGRPASGGLLDDDDDDEPDTRHDEPDTRHDDPSPPSFPRELPSSNSGSPRINFSGLTESIKQQSRRKLPQDAAATASSNRSLLSTPGASKRAVGLKTVHSGRSLGSASSKDSKKQQQQQQPSLGAGGGSGITSTNDPQIGSPHRWSLMRRSQGVRPQFRAQSGVNSPPASPRATLFASKLAKRSIKSRFAVSQRASAQRIDLTSLNREETPPSMVRRYKPGDYVLVCNHQSRWANLVNRYGFPPTEGATPEEQRGPYIYVISKVKEVHFEEFAAYYTVVRCDTGAEQRADADFMEPLRNARGEAAALRAATQSSTDLDGLEGEPLDLLMGEHEQATHRNSCTDAIQTICFFLLLPFLWLYECCYYVTASFIRPVWTSCISYLQGQARQVLNGMDPFVCRMRLTCVNIHVICSTWYMFIDQARLAFFPPQADYAVACINLAVWVVLVLELFAEAFIRPDGYRSLLESDKAFAPTTVRFISAFHLLIEFVSLGIFVPEFYCILSSTVECDERLPFSFYNAALIGVIGPTRLDSFYGKAYFCLIRLRVFGLVRHWKSMWINTTFIQSNRNKSKQGGILSTIIPQRGSLRSASDRERALERKSSLVDSQKRRSDGDEREDEQKDKDNALTNASTIGTALMVINSYRALVIMWLITGVFPMLLSFVSVYINKMAPAETRFLQATNLVASDTSNATCEYLRQSVQSWVLGLTAPDYSKNKDDPYLLSLEIRPIRCPEYFYNNTHFTVTACDLLEEQLRRGGLSEEKQDFSQGIIESYCDSWRIEPGDEAEIAHQLGLRTGSVLIYTESQLWNLTNVQLNETSVENYSVLSCFDESYTIQTAALASLLLQLCLLIAVLGGLSVLRRDAEVLVLGPLRRMLKIVARYAKNPLVQPKIHRRRLVSSSRKASGRHSNRHSARHSGEEDSTLSDDSSSSDSSDEGPVDQVSALGRYETEQLITAVTKITDLLRKCWGVAGADIISTNLATREGALTEVFNPTVQGKSVYALFGFAAINGFDHAVRNLSGDVMILINDVAAVLHGEVFRWGFGDSGQCNKNLGGAFLMVFRIGLVKEVVEKLEQATDVIFSTGSSNTSAAVKRRIKQQMSTVSRAASTGSTASTSTTPSVTAIASAKHVASNLRRKINRSASVKAMSLSLESLPGIRTFTDRAVIGMLKCFAAIHRDNKIRNWNNDFRLSAGVGTFTVSMIYGMDAGWAVEGAVGSEYKIDATYLSPHVNMASRMMSACKQYGVSIMLSQAVQELMSDVAQSKLRHLDTVTVKGSSVKQRIYTYDARPKGVDFFLYSRSDDQADVDAERYTTNIWNTDQDLKAMRQHMTDDFLKEFNHGRDAFLAGNWKSARKHLERANEIMIETALEEGYLEDEFEELGMIDGEEAHAAAEELKRENGDGPSLYLLSFMKSEGGVAPKGWDGWHPLTRK